MLDLNPERLSTVICHHQDLKKQVLDWAFDAKVKEMFCLREPGSIAKPVKAM